MSCFDRDEFEDELANALLLVNGITSDPEEKRGQLDRILMDFLWRIGAGSLADAVERESAKALCLCDLCGEVYP